MIHFFGHTLKNRIAKLNIIKELIFKNIGFFHLLTKTSHSFPFLSILFILSSPHYQE